MFINLHNVTQNLNPMLYCRHLNIHACVSVYRLSSGMLVTELHELVKSKLTQG